MEKIVIPSTWDFGESICQLVKYSSKGLIGHDYSVLVKRAGEEAAHWLQNIMIKDANLVPVHVIAMGATEGYGPNRNGDGFKEAALKRYHDTFVKYGNHYRHHKNKDPKIRYGQVKASFYNPTMRRVELLTALNANKEAAEKYGGFVADKELELIHQGKDIPVSMACKVAYDECSGCGNKARNRSEYCTADNCKYGGCRDNLTKVAEDGHILHVDNPHPSFFDISTVIRPADRIAYGNVADYLQKAASGEILGGAALADAYNITTPINVLLDKVANRHTATQLKLAYALAAIEDNIEDNQSRYNDIARAFSLSNSPPDLAPLGAAGTEKFATGLAALADQNIVLPVEDFLRLVIGGTKYADKLAEYSEAVPGLLPGVFNRLLLSDNLLIEYLDDNPYIPSQKLASATQREWASKLSNDHSLELGAVRRRAALAAIRGNETAFLKKATYNSKLVARPVAEALATEYALYKIAYLAHKNVHMPFTQELVVLQNYTS